LNPDNPWVALIKGNSWAGFIEPDNSWVALIKGYSWAGFIKHGQVF